MTETASRTHQMIFVNLPVADLGRSREFFTGLGYAFDERVCNEQGLGLMLGPDSYAMLLTHEFFASFHRGQIAAPDQREVLICLSMESADDVDRLVDAALDLGGTEVRPGVTTDFMHGRSYADLDGHVWEIMWMDVALATEAGVFSE